MAKRPGVRRSWWGRFFGLQWFTWLVGEPDDGLTGLLQTALTWVFDFLGWTAFVIFVIIAIETSQLDQDKALQPIQVPVSASDPFVVWDGNYNVITVPQYVEVERTPSWQGFVTFCAAYPVVAAAIITATGAIVAALLVGISSVIAAHAKAKAPEGDA